MQCGTCTMKIAIAFVTAALSLSLPLAGAHRPLADSPPAPLQSSTDGAPDPQVNRANLTEILTATEPYQTFLRYLQQTNLVEVLQNQAYRTHHGLTIFVPVDRAFAAVEPSVLSGLKKHQLKSLMMYHALARYYAQKDFNGLSQINPVTTFAGGQYTVNVTLDAGVIHLRSRWADAKILGVVYEAAPMAVYEIDRVLLPEAIFRAQPPVEDTPPSPAPAPSAPNDANVTSPGRKAGGADAGSSACRAGDPSARYATAAAFGTMALVAL